MSIKKDIATFIVACWLKLLKCLKQKPSPQLTAARVL